MLLRIVGNFVEVCWKCNCQINFVLFFSNRIFFWQSTVLWLLMRPTRGVYIQTYWLVSSQGLSPLDTRCSVWPVFKIQSCICCSVVVKPQTSLMWNVFIVHVWYSSLLYWIDLKTYIVMNFHNFMLYTILRRVNIWLLWPMY